MTKWRGEVASYAPNAAEITARLAGGAGALSLASMLAMSSAAAADWHWDANQTTIGSGGTGTWNLTSPFWSPSADGVSGPYSVWNNSALDSAIFGGTAGTVTLGGAMTAGGLTFNSNNYVLSGGTLNLAGAAPTIAANGSATINSILAGTSGFTKDGAGTLTLGGINTFTGDIFLNAGNITAGSDAALGAAGNNIFTAAGVSVGLTVSGAGTTRTVTIGDAGRLVVGRGAGSANITGNGRVYVGADVTMSNDASTYTGSTTFNGKNGVAWSYFTSIGNLGEASSLGAPVTVSDGTIVFDQSSQYSDNVVYIGDGDSSNRNWQLNGASALIRNQGTGTLTITGNVNTSGGSGFYAEGADIGLLGILSGGNYSFDGNTGRVITLGGANTYTGATGINTVTVRAAVLANAGTASSFGAGAGAISIGGNGAMSYTGAGASSNRQWVVGAGSILNDGSGALALSGAVDLGAVANDSFTLGGSFAGENTLSGVVSGAGDLKSDGAGTWVLNGANTRTGAIIVENGTLRAGNAAAFGTTTGLTVNGGTLDLGGFDLTAPTLQGTGGKIALGAGMLTIATKQNTAFGGAIAGSGGLTKSGAGTLTLSGANTYTGNTSLNGGGLRLDFSAPGAPANNIIAAASTLNVAGGKLDIIGADGAANSQTFDGLNITAGSNRIAATSGTGGSMTVNFGDITRTGGVIDFALPTDGSFTTTSSALGGWATVNGSDYAKVVGGAITAFEAGDYTNKDDAANWLTGEVISDAGGAPDTAFFGTVSGSQQLGGLKYSAAGSATVNVAAGQTLGIDGTIIVADTVGSANQRITGGQLTGGAGGGVLGLQQNGGGNFTIDSTITDNGGATGFTKAGTGSATLSGANTYTGVTTLSGGTLAIMSVANAGAASAIGAATVDASNLVLESGTLRYIGATASTDRGFTLINGGPSRTIDVASAGTNVTFSGLVTSPDDAGFIKSGAGTLTLANDSNDYIGVTTVNGGTLAVSALADGGQVSSIGKSSSDAANLVLAGGTLDYLGATASTDRSFTLSGGAGIGVADAGATLTMSGVAVGTGGLRKEGDGTLVLSGTNTYTGTTTVNGGTLRAGSAQAFGSANNFMTVNTGGTLELGGYDTTVAGLLGGGLVDLGNNTLVSSGGSANGFTGRITGTGGFTRSGSWTQTLSGCQNDYTGKTTINGTLSVDCLANGGQASGIGASSNGSGNLLFNSGALNYTGGSVVTDRGFTLQSSWGTIGVVNAATTLEFTGQIVGGGGLEKSGAGTLVLSGNNSYTSRTLVSGGTLRADSATAFGGANGATLANASDVLLDLNGYSMDLGYLTGGGTAGGTIDIADATLTLSYASSSFDFAGKMTGAGALVKSGGATQRLSGCANDYSGSTSITGGVLEVSCLTDGGVASSIGMSSADASNLVIDGGTLRYVGAGGSTDRQFTLGASGGNGLEASGTGAIDFTSNATVTFAAANTAQTLRLAGTNTGDNKLGAELTDNGTGVTSLTKSGTGTWVLTGNNTYTGITRIDGGVLGVDKLADGGLASSLGASSADASNLVIGNGSTLRYTGTGDSTNRLFTLSAGVTYLQSSGTGAIVFTDTGPVTLAGNNQGRTIALGGTNAGDNTLAGSIGDAGTGKTILAKNDAGTWVLTGTNTYTGNTVVNDGILKIGGGGTTGSITSDVIVTGAGTLGFNRSDAYSYDGLISGTGIVRQIGSGVTTLTGNNTFTGETFVNAGTLLVNGDQTAATGQTTVASGGTLGGTGTIGGSVAIADGVLSPGSNGAGTLTINGDLGLSGGSILAMQFGEAGTTGGALNDLITVKGNLTLDGTLDVTETAGGSYGPGIYRIIDYTGTLTDNGLDIGTLPNGSGSIQTSITGQVNLLAGGNNFSFWDGDAGPKFNSVVNGGNGTWQNGTGNNNWTEADGLVNAAYADGTFAIFAGTGGTVTIDNGPGQVEAEGMQFATDGYVIGGGALGLVGPQSTIRVGDGTAAGAAYTATINSVLTGNTQLEKTDAGTLVLTGVNTYTGGTAINGGTVRIAGDANLGAAAGGLSFDGGTLETTASMTSARAITLAGAGTLLTNADLALSGGISGVGALTKVGAATLTLTGDATHTGGTTIADGTLQIGNGGTSGSIAGDIVNNGALAFNRSDDTGFAGNISGTGSVSQTGGILRLTGNSTYAGTTTITDGELRLEAGAIIGNTSNTVLKGTSATLTVTGDGSALTTAALSLATDAGSPATVNVEDGGHLIVSGTTQVNIGAGTGNQGTVNVTGAGSLFDVAGAVRVSATPQATGIVNVTDGGKTQSGGLIVGPASVPLTTGSASVTISGAGSGWTTGSLTLAEGSMSILNGGSFKSSGSTTSIGTTGAGSQLLVSGAGSNVTLAGDANLGATFFGPVSVASGILTVADGASVDIGGVATLGQALGRTGILNIGGAESAAAVGAGAFNAASLVFGPGTGRLNFNHTDTAYAFATAMSGFGTINQLSGVTLLDGDSSAFAGATAISGGELYVNNALGGDVSAATGGTLGGTGTIGGSVVLGSGAILNPGDLGTAPGTLTISGNLNLASGSVQNFSFGQADVPGGPLNDLINVGGNLTLGGTLNVDTSAGGSFDPGVYRVFNYAGTLTDTGWAVNIPASFYVQTSIDHQVNLVNTAGMALRFWDGDAGPKNDGNIDGGNGIWQAFGVTPDNGNDNWTEDGTANAPFQDAAFAVFMGAAGAVTVDDSKGAVNVSGMQFITDGYVVAGDAINMVGTPDTVIRVGDGTTGGAGTTATIEAALNGNSQLVKSDMGTLVLTGANGYTGGTMLKGGVLQVSADANLGAALGGVSFDGGTLQTTADLSTSRYVALIGDGTLLTDTGTTLTLDGPISGGGRLTKEGDGTLVLLTDAVHGGGTTIARGTLQLGDGGTTGGVSGDIVNDGLLVANRSDLLALGGDISGIGGLTQAGPGTTVLSGLNSYLGATNINAGTLIVDGDQSAAIGATSVATGATLGGSGIIGGNVSIADGAALEPGSTAGAAGTLTIKGDLALAAGSALNMQFGAANVAGGTLNDLIEVEGNLALDGTLNVAETVGGTFGAGIYRVINYDGTLTDNGLTLGSMPADSALFLQTSVANQVNLVNTVGLTLNYWDGDAGPKFDGVIAGGNGNWQNSSGNDNWTDAAGAINAPYANGSFAIFTGAAGTVTVDNSLGQIAATGMQFAVDGYRIEGEALELTGAQATIRVGDGTTAGAAMSATIAAELTGTSQLVKGDAGTLILTGVNSYGGGTLMAGGILQVAADTALGAISGGLSFDGGALQTTADMTSDHAVTFTSDGTFLTDADTSLTLNGALSGAGAFHKGGDGTLVLTADSSAYGGAASIDAGTLVANGTLGGTLDVNAGGRLEGIGKVGATTNSGVIAAGQGGVGTLTIKGDYTGDDGRIEIVTVLGNDSSETSRLVIDGATSGTSLVGVINRGGLGAQTVEGIKIIDVTGASNGSFTLDGDYLFEGEQAVVAGAYGYRLYKGGASTPGDGDWYLRSALLDPVDPTDPLYQPGVPIYESYAAAMQQLSKLGTMQQRIGNRQWAAPADGVRGDAKQDRLAGKNGIWARIEAAHAEFEPAESTSRATYDTSVWKLQAGVDGLLAENDAGRFVGGVFVQYGTVSSNVRSPYGIGGIDTTGYSLGATLTWYGESGFYADAQAQVTWFDSDLNSATAGTRLVSDNSGVGYGLSIEAGQRIALDGAWSLTPQVQLAYSSVSFDDFTDSFEADVSLDHSQSLVGRFGIAANHDIEWRGANGQINRSHLYGIANIYYEFAGRSRVTVSDVSFASRNDRLYGGLGIGGSFNWADDKYTIYGEAQVNTSLENMGDNGAIGGTVGFRMRW